MEIINGYSYSLGLTPSNILSSDIATGDVSETKSSKIFFFTGDMDLNSLYNISSESQLLTSYSSTYLGTVTTDLNYKYLKNAKKNIIKMSTPNARRFKDPRYINNTYVLGTAFTKPTIGTKYKFKFTNSTAKDGFLVNGSDINVNYTINSKEKNVHKVISGIDGFDELFLGGFPVDGGVIDFNTNAIYGYRITGTGAKGYRSITMQEMINKGYSKIVIVVNSSTYGGAFLGYDWNNKCLSNYNESYGPATYIIDFNSMTASVTKNYRMDATTVNLNNYDLSSLRMGSYSEQAQEGWQYWNVTLYSLQNTYDIESDFFTTTGDITITNPSAMTHSGFEVIPYGDDDKPLSNQITWCAIKVGNNTLGDKLIFTDDIGTFINPSFVNLSKRECVYGIDNILHSLKIEVSEKGN